jgi:hypothetical protein
MSPTLNQIIKKLVTIAAAHKQVRTAKHVKAEDFVVFDYKDVDYPAVWYTLNTSAINGKEKTYSIIVTIADIHHVENMDELEMQSDCELIAHDLLAQVGWDKHEWTMQRNTNFEYFRQGQEDVLAGVTFQIDLKVPIIYDNCQVPTDYILPESDFIIVQDYLVKRTNKIIDFIVGSTAPMQQGSTQYQNNMLEVPPLVFIDGLILTYQIRSDRRYVSHNATTKTITINGGVNEGENVQIYL